MKLESDLYKLIPNALPMNLRVAVWQALLKKDYRLGWNDYDGVEAPFSKSYYLAHVARKGERDRHGKTKFDYFGDLGIPDEFCQEYHDIMGDKKPTYCSVNLVYQGQQFWPHTHRKQTSIVYYANLEWHNKWGGETIIYENDGETFHAAVPYVPGAVLWLGEGVTHAIRPPSTEAPMYRFTMGIFYD
jgi:hypothetical protein